jgi:DNA polymerase III sliding clamp (beta) subunit (PCNA family)
LRQVADRFGEEPLVTILRSDDEVAIQADSKTLRGQRIAGSYVPFEQLLVKHPKSHAVVDRDKLLEALVALTPGQHAVGVSLRWIGSKKLVVRLLQGPAMRTLELTESPHGGCWVQVNSACLKEILEHMPTGDLRLGFSPNPHRTWWCPRLLTFQPVEDDNYLVVLAPIGPFLGRVPENSEMGMHDLLFGSPKWMT